MPLAIKGRTSDTPDANALCPRFQPPYSTPDALEAHFSSLRDLFVVQNEGQPPPQSGPDRYAFTPPEAPPQIEFKKVRRPVEGSGQSTSSKKARPGRRKVILLTAAGLVVVMMLGLGWVGLQGFRAKGHLQTAAGLFVQLQSQIQKGDVAAAKGTLAALQIETKAARDETDGVGWAVTGVLPGLGDDLRAVRTVSAVLDDLATDGLPALLDGFQSLGPRVGSKGRLQP